MLRYFVVGKKTLNGDEKNVKESKTCSMYVNEFVLANCPEVRMLMMVDCMNAIGKVTIESGGGMGP